MSDKAEVKLFSFQPGHAEQIENYTTLFGYPEALELFKLIQARDDNGWQHTPRETALMLLLRLREELEKLLFTAKRWEVGTLGGGAMCGQLWELVRFYSCPVVFRKHPAWIGGVEIVFKAGEVRDTSTTNPGVDETTVPDVHRAAGDTVAVEDKGKPIPTHDHQCRRCGQSKTHKMDCPLYRSTPARVMQTDCIAGAACDFDGEMLR